MRTNTDRPSSYLWLPNRRNQATKQKKPSGIPKSSIGTLAPGDEKTRRSRKLRFGKSTEDTGGDNPSESTAEAPETETVSEEPKTETKSEEPTKEEEEEVELRTPDGPPPVTEDTAQKKQQAADNEDEEINIDDI